ncbi:AlpA family transcriptional regulator [Comamonas odontotermitis]|uniref:AlpA family transcriptional regulator n=1 Tax=Comamonas odontotermitis TaxID=379895 RepID=UPI0037523334
MRVLKLKEVLFKTSLGKTTLYMLVKDAAFPKPIPLGLRAVGWLESEVDTWIQSRISARDRAIN